MSVLALSVSVMELASSIAEIWKSTMVWTMEPEEECPSTRGILPCCAVISRPRCPYGGREDRTAWVGVWELAPNAHEDKLGV